jgi:hypothetical protein
MALAFTKIFIFRFLRMSYGGKYSFCPGAPSLTAMKYLKTYIPNRDFAPGERYRHYRNMEAKVNTNILRVLQKQRHTLS